MHIEDLLDIIDDLHGAGLEVTDKDMLGEELEVMGFSWRDDDTQVGDSDDEC